MTRAVIFTHIKEKQKLSNAELFRDFEKRRVAFFKSCLQSPNIGLVFVYSSYGVEQYVPALLRQGQNASIPLDVLDGEQRLYDALQIVVDHAAAVIDPQNPEVVKENGPRFVFVGVRELACLMARLERHNPELVLSLAHKGEFTYDSPKYIEAIIRLVRSKDGDHADPVLRVDADVEVNQTAVQKIIDQALRCQLSRDPVWWFSGSYRGATAGDPVNAFAVRQQWLIEESSRATPKKFALVKGGSRFLADLAQIGATQFTPQLSDPDDGASDPRLSAAAVELIHRRAPSGRGHSKSRSGPQVISGAGLVASHHAIRRLPPFMNAPAMVVWIDDHLKRLLHEAIGDSPDPLERVPGAVMKQDRFPKGITHKDVDEAPQYFERLLTGCVMEATIQDDYGKRGPLADTVWEIVEGHRKELSSADRIGLEERLRIASETRFDEAIWLWSHADYGNGDLKGWAGSFAGRSRICKLVCDISIAYVELCILWPQHVVVIDGLTEQEAYWAFMRPRPLSLTASVLAGSPLRLPIKRKRRGRRATV